MRTEVKRPLVERDYLAALRDIITPEDWVAICRRGIEDAKAGDAKARLWVERHVLGPHPPSFLELAAREALGVEAEHEIQALAEETENPTGSDLLETLTGVKSESLLQRAARIANSVDATAPTE